MLSQGMICDRSRTVPESVRVCDTVIVPGYEATPVSIIIIIRSIEMSRVFLSLTHTAGSWRLDSLQSNNTWIYLSSRKPETSLAYWLITFVYADDLDSTLDHTVWHTYEHCGFLVFLPFGHARNFGTVLTFDFVFVSLEYLFTSSPLLMHLCEMWKHSANSGGQISILSTYLAYHIQNNHFFSCIYVLTTCLYLF